MIETGEQRLYIGIGTRKGAENPPGGFNHHENGISKYAARLQG
jgi:hypothetical protein